MDKPLFYVYMLTSFEKKALYIGFTNNLQLRLVEHWAGLHSNAFTKRYRVHYLVWFETTQYVLNAITREKALKGLLRAKKEALITESNPEWRFLNEEVLGNWPPTAEQVDMAKERIRQQRYT